MIKFYRIGNKATVVKRRPDIVANKMKATVLNVFYVHE